MSFLVNSYHRQAPSLTDVSAHAAHLDSLKKEFESYMTYLKSIKDSLPLGIYEFATADWHYDPRFPKCPHDAWIQEIKIKEIGEGETQDIRKTQIEIILLGAYHDRLLKVTYEDVASYSITPSIRNNHGDWLIDEINLSESRLVVHEIEFRHESIFRFECRNMRFEEQLTTTPYTAVWSE